MKADNEILFSHSLSLYLSLYLSPSIFISHSLYLSHSVSINIYIYIYIYIWFKGTFYFLLWKIYRPNKKKFCIGKNVYFLLI